MELYGSKKFINWIKSYEKDTECNKNISLHSYSYKIDKLGVIINNIYYEYMTIIKDIYDIEEYIAIDNKLITKHKYDVFCNNEDFNNIEKIVNKLKLNLLINNNVVSSSAEIAFYINYCIDNDINNTITNYVKENNTTFKAIDTSELFINYELIKYDLSMNNNYYSNREWRKLFIDNQLSNMNNNQICHFTKLYDWSIAKNNDEKYIFYLLESFTYFNKYNKAAGLSS